MNATFTANAAVAPTLSAIDNIYLRATNATAAGTANAVIDLSNANGVEQAWADRVEVTGGAGAGTASATFTSMSTSITAGIKGGSSVAANRGDAAWVYTGITGAADEVSLVLDGAGVRDVSLGDVAGAAATGLETLNIVTQNAASTIGGTLVSQGVSKVNVTGDQNLTIAGSDFAATVTVDASALTGNLNFASEANTLTFKGGEGNDRVNMGAIANITAADNLDGGEGTNTLAFAGNSASANLGALSTRIKNFQVAEVTDVNAAARTIDADHTSALGITSFKFSDTAGAGSTATVSNAQSGVSVEYTTDIGTAAVVNFKATADTVNDIVNVTLTNADIASLRGGANDFANTLNIVSKAGTGGALDDNANVIDDIGDTAAMSVTTVNVSGSANIKIGTDGLAGANQAAITQGTITKFDASNATGNVWFQANAAGSAIEILGGSGADRLIGSNGNDVINAGAGNDRVTGGAGGDTLTGGEGNDTFVYAAVGNSQAADGDLSGVDKITDFRAGGTDVINVNAFGGTGAGARVEVQGKVDLATFEADMASILSGANALAVNGVALVGVNDGTLNGKTFLIIGDNANAGFAVADDIVIELVGTSVTSGLAADWVSNAGL